MKNNLSNLLVILILPGLLLFPACSNDSSWEKPPTAIKGVLDLTGWDLDKDGPVNLVGEWEFYWRKHLESKDFRNGNLPVRTGFINMPGYWNDYVVDGKALSGDGYATYRLKVIMNDQKGNGESILVVDDVESQKDISCKMLDILGYKTKAVSSGEEAVEYLKAHTVDLILLDMIMDPGINGRETYERMIKIHPKQKAIIVSGFAETDEVKETQKLGAGKYVKKPYTLDKIGFAVKEELEK